MEHFGEMTCNQVTGACKAYLTARTSGTIGRQPVKASTARRELDTLSAALNFAWKTGKMDRPVAVLKPETKSKEARWLTRNEAASLVWGALGFAPTGFDEHGRVVEENKDFYYKALRRTQTTLNGDAPDWQPWVGFFLRCLKKQKDALAARLDRERVEAAADADLPDLSLKVLSALGSRERLTITQLADITQANRNTLKVRLRELVQAGRIRQHGKARATWYALA